MTLGLSNNGNGGNYLPIVKWDARAGRLFRVDREQGANGWSSNDVDLTNQKPRFAVDFGSIETGYMHFTATGPDFRMAPLGQPMPERPTKDYKQGFRMKLVGRILGGVREFAASAKAVLTAVDSLHTVYEGRPEAVAGQIPVVELNGSTAVVTNGPQGKVTSYSPIFDIVGWTDRDEATYGPRTVAPPQPSGTAPAPAPVAAAPVAPAAPPANHVPPPAAVATAAMAPQAAAAMPDSW